MEAGERDGNEGDQKEEPVDYSPVNVPVITLSIIIWHMSAC